MFDQLALTLKRNALKFHAGHDIFCPRCQGILDARRAVELDFSQNGKLVQSKIICATCFDKVIAPNLQAAKLPEGVTVEVNDGRVLFARPKRVRKPKPAPKAAAERETVMDAQRRSEATGLL